MSLEPTNTASETSIGEDVSRVKQGVGTFALQLRRALTLFLFLMVVCAPHSIAATQIAWSCALLLWLISFFILPRRPVRRTPIDYPLAVFVILTIISAFFSYDPDVSLPLLRGVFLFTIIYLFVQNISSMRTLRLLALTLVASCLINVFYTLGARISGRGVKVESIAAASPLYSAGIRDGDTLLKIDGREPRNLENVVAALDGEGAPALITIYRHETTPTIPLPRGQLLEGATPQARLGVSDWSRGRDWRASGFYGHYVTYAEVLQLIMSFAFGLFISLPQKISRLGALLLLALAGLGVALLLTVTRASWLAFLLSALVVVGVGTSRRALLVVIVCALPLILAGLFVLRQQRNVGFYDRTDQSITWRETVWREGFHLLISKPRHLLVGVGMNSIKRHWREWGLFDGGRIPIGHMHSNPLQLALERGVPALLAWLVLMFIYGRMLYQLARSGSIEGWIERGITLGALGGLIGFLSSGVVHYNWGDSEVVMVFYIIMGFTLFLNRDAHSRSNLAKDAL